MVRDGLDRSTMTLRPRSKARKRTHTMRGYDLVRELDASGRHMPMSFITSTGDSPSYRRWMTGASHPWRTDTVERVVDLVGLNAVATGLAERVLAQVQARKSVILFDHTLTTRMPEARKLATDLVALAREHKSRLEDTGADDLFVGYRAQPPAPGRRNIRTVR
jgi:hypothetical protein